MLPSLKSALFYGLLASEYVNAVNLTKNSQEFFDESMSFLDTIYDRSASYLYNFYYPLAAASHETRSTVWYATGLLQRQQGDDVEQAIKIITKVIGDQEKNVSAQWYGDYKYYPEQPKVGSPAYPPVIYGSWDPNWRGFIGTTLIIIYEEFGDLLPSYVQDLILESLYNNTIGDTYRVGGVDDDNLYPSYSNPWLMRCVVSGWTGRKFGDANMTQTGEETAKEALDLFNRNNTLSEFNSPTYAGVSVYALTLWAKYLPEDSIMKQNAPRMLADIWDSLATQYNPTLNNLAGPWDRAYGYDMNKYLGIISIYIWSFLGKSQAFRNKYVWSLTHADDFEYAPVIAVLAPYHDSLIPQSTVQKLASNPERFYETSAYAPPHDLVPRNITSWISDKLQIGAESYVQDVLGGAREDSSQWNPAVFQWAYSDDSVGFFTFYPSEVAVEANVAANSLNLTYPDGNSTSTFTFLVSPNPLGGKRTIYGIEDIEGVEINVEGSVDAAPEITFCGLYGGTCDIIHGFEFWNLTFAMPDGSSETPWIHFSVTHR